MIPIFNNLTRADLRDNAIVVVWATLAVMLRNVAPLAFWLTLVVLPTYVIGRWEMPYLRSPAGRRVLIICGFLLITHVIWAVVRSFYYDASTPGTYWLDDHNYYKEAIAIAETWKTGNYPDFWLKGSPPYLGTLHIGYHRVLSGVFYLFGGSTIGGLLLNAVCAAFLPLFAALCSRYLWSPDSNGNIPLLRDYGFIGAGLAALYPNQFYWASFLMKDMYVTFIFLTTLTLVLGAYRRKNVAMGIATLLLFPYLFTVRIYAALSLLAGTITLPLMGFSRKVVLRAALTGGAVLILLCAYTTRGNAVYRQLRDSFVALAPPGLDNPVDLLTQMMAGIPRLFLAPYAWLILDTPSPMYGMYPGMWYLYIVGYPLGFAGLYAAVKKDVKPAVVLISAFGLTSLVFLSAVYQGDASRQRFYLEYVMLLFAAYGVVNFSRGWVIGIMTLEAAFALGQLISLR